MYTQGSLHILRLNIQKWGLPFWFLGCPLYFLFLFIYFFFYISIHFYNLSAVIWFTKGNQFETVTSFIIAQLLFHLSHSAIVIIILLWWCQLISPAFEIEITVTWFLNHIICSGILEWNELSYELGLNCIINFLVREMVFCYQNCSDLLWEKIVLVIEKNLQRFWDH